MRRVILWGMVAVACLALGAARSAAQPAAFLTTPQWQSGSAELTRSVALGDIDGDGALDLVAGNIGQANTLHLNQGGLFATGPAWLSMPAAVTTSVALGDIDGDGDLDLVCGNSAASNVLYLNQGGIFETTPSWSSGPANTTVAVALGDVDGDGDLDLVCGNSAGPNTLYLNAGGGTLFAISPAWTAAITDSTRSIALGDIDGDGRLDLLSGNKNANTLYQNLGGFFAALPLWTSVLTSVTPDVDLADINGDGRLDIICANFGQSNTVYANQGGTFSTIPSWLSTELDSTVSVALGDVDLDGDLDAVFGNSRQSNVLYLNDGGGMFFETTPAWSSTPRNDTAGLALGDVDGDGAVDLVCGNSGQSNTAYVNQSEPFDGTRAWPSGPMNVTLGVAVGDIDADGDLDLVCGNSGQNTLYIGNDPWLESTPAWLSTPANLTAAVALGDINGDGAVDLVCGNAAVPGESNTAYLNAGGVFNISPDWVSAPPNVTLGIALGDIDGDGRIDLVCGNSNDVNSLYLNQGAILDVVPAWSSGLANLTTGVALGDVDGDGDLDLVCGNSGQANTLYLNTGGAFDTNPAWSSLPENATTSIALADVNGDGTLDLVCGNVGEANTVYLGLGGVFTLSPDWSSAPTNATTGVALGDIDGDGYLDLVCANVGEQNTAYMNESGRLRTAPTWLSGSSGATEGIALGDIDGDGDLDVIAGHKLQFNTVHRGRKNPPYLGDPLNPRNHLANNSAFIRRADVDSVAANTKRVFFNIVDIESDPAWIRPEYQFEGEPIWYPVETGAGSAWVGPFNASPAGVNDSIDWDLKPVMFDSRNVVVRLTVAEIPDSVSIIQYVPSYLKSVGRVLPMRAEITASPRALDFPTVTVGDSVDLDLVVFNRGTEDLTIGQIVLPSSEMRVEPAVPLVVAPGTSATLRVFVEAVQDTAIDGYIELVSNDPLTPTDSILVRTDIRPLRVKSRLLTTDSIIPLGEAATIIVEPFAGVTIEGGALFHRSLGAATFDAIPLGPSGNDWIAVIPGAEVTEVGLEYYIRVENLPAVNTDPVNAPSDSVIFQPVEKPMAIASIAQPTLGDDFVEGQDIRVDVMLPQGAGFVSGMLHFREGARATYSQTPLVFVGTVPSAAIPAFVVGPRGVEYWVEVETLTRTLTDPPADPALRPVSVGVVVTDLIEPNRHAGRRYRLFSVPLRMQGSILGSVADDLGGEDNTEWRLFSYDTGSNSYESLPSDSLSAFRQGEAYWLITRKSHQLGTGPDRGTTARTDQPFEIVLTPGFNLVGSPFAFTVPWDSIGVDTCAAPDTSSVCTISMADARQSGILQQLIGYTPGPGGGYGVDSILVSFDGYWIKNLSSTPVVLKVPPVDVALVGVSVVQGTRRARSLPERGADAMKARRDGDAEVVVAQPGGDARWGVRIKVSSAGAFDFSGYLGMNPEASNGNDRYDIAKPPPAPGRSVSLYFPHLTWKNHADVYMQDIRGAYVSLGGDVTSTATQNTGARKHATSTAVHDADSWRQPEPVSEIAGLAVPADLWRQMALDGDVWGHVWRFDVEKMFADEAPGDAVWLEFEGLDSVPEDAEIYLVDLRLGDSVNLRGVNGYRFRAGRTVRVENDRQARFLLIVGSEGFVSDADLLVRPTEMRLHPNYPNPFNPTTIIRYDVASASRVTLRVYDVSGALVRELYNGSRPRGVFEAVWDATNTRGGRVASGVYFYRFTAGAVTQTRKMILLK